MEKIVTINGMKCDGCVNIVKEHLEKISGIQSVEVNLENKTATIDSTKEISTDELQQALSDTKFVIA